MTSRIADRDTQALCCRRRWPGRGLVPIMASLLLIGIALLAPAALGAQTTGVISGTVVNGTQGGSDVAGLEVQLHKVAHDTGERTEQPVTARVDARGAFSFSGLATAGKNGYVATVLFQGITYASEMVVFQADESAKTIQVKIFEPIASAEAVTVRQHHLVFDVDAEQRVLKVLDIAIIVNRSDTAFVGKPAGAGAETVRLLLPAGARAIQLGEGLEENMVPTPSGLAYQAPILPGETSLVVMYLLDYTSPTLTLTESLSLPTDSVDLLIADRGMKATGTQFASQESIQLNGQQYLRLTRKGLAPDSPVVIQLADLPGVAMALDVGPWPVAAGLAVLAGAGTYLLATRRRQPGGWRPARRRIATPQELDDSDEPDDPDGPDEPDEPAQTVVPVRRLVARRPAPVRAVVADDPDDEELEP